MAYFVLTIVSHRCSEYHPHLPVNRAPLPDARCAHPPPATPLPRPTPFFRPCAAPAPPPHPPRPRPHTHPPTSAPLLSVDLTGREARKRSPGPQVGWRPTPSTTVAGQDDGSVISGTDGTTDRPTDRQGSSASSRCGAGPAFQGRGAAGGGCPRSGSDPALETFLSERP